LITGGHTACWWTATAGRVDGHAHYVGPEEGAVSMDNRSEDQSSLVDEVATATPPCPPWCVDYEDLDEDLRAHKGVASPRIPAVGDFPGDDEYVVVRALFLDAYPPHRPEADHMPKVELCLGAERACVDLLPADARQLARELLRRADEIERGMGTRQPQYGFGRSPRGCRMLARFPE
jgi:hypothetical protein